MLIRSTLYLSAAALVLAACSGSDDLDSRPGAMDGDAAQAGAMDHDNASTTADLVESPESAIAKTANNEYCDLAGPQTPRDIASPMGMNTVEFPMAETVEDLNLCNIHTHTPMPNTRAPAFPSMPVPVPMAATSAMARPS